MLLLVVILWSGALDGGLLWVRDGVLDWLARVASAPFRVLLG